MTNDAGRDAGSAGASAIGRRSEHDAELPFKAGRHAPELAGRDPSGMTSARDVKGWGALLDEKRSGSAAESSIGQIISEAPESYDYTPGPRSERMLPFSDEGVAWLSRTPLLIVHGRLGIEKVARDIASRIDHRWARRIDSNQDISRLRITDPDRIRGEIVDTNARRPADKRWPALLFAELSYEELYNSLLSQELLISKSRAALLEALAETRAVLIVAVSVSPSTTDPTNLLGPDVALEVPWPQVWLHEVRSAGRGMRMSDEDALELLALIESYTRTKQNQSMDSSLFEAVQEIRSEGRGLDELRSELTEALNQVLVDRRERFADPADGPDRYDPGNAILESVCIASLFLCPMERSIFDNLIGELLSAEAVPAEILAEIIASSGGRTRPAAAPSPQWAPWPGLPSYGYGAPPPNAPPAASWKQHWSDNADLYRERCKLVVSGTFVRLPATWARQRLLEALLERRQARVERFARRIIDNGTILVADPLVVDAAGRLLAILLGRLGLSMHPGSLEEVLGKTIDRALAAGTSPARLAERLSMLLDFLSDASGGDFRGVVAGVISTYVRRNIADCDRCRMLVALCTRVRNALPRWRDGELVGDTVKWLLASASSGVRGELADELFSGMEQAARNPQSRLRFLSPLRRLLPTEVDQRHISPMASVCLRLWDGGLNRDIAWKTTRSYRERGSNGTLADVAFGADHEHQVELVRGLSAFKLAHVSLAAPDDQTSLRNRFMDVFWATMHGYSRRQANIVESELEQFSALFAALALTDRATIPAVAIDLIEVHQDPASLEFDLVAELSGASGRTIRLDQDLFGKLPHLYRAALDGANVQTPLGRVCRDCLARLDLYHAALIAEWFFLRFDLRKDLLSDTDYDRVVAFADIVHEVDREGLGRRLPSSFRRLSRIVKSYGPLLNSLGIERSVIETYHVKAHKLEGLGELIENRGSTLANRHA